jgi:hypothetical protein
MTRFLNSAQNEVGQSKRGGAASWSVRRGRTKLSFCLASSASLARLAGVQFAIRNSNFEIRNLDPMPLGPEPVEGPHALCLVPCALYLSRFSIPFTVHLSPFTPY